MEDKEQNLILGLILRTSTERISSLLEELRKDPGITLIYQRVSTGPYLYVLAEGETLPKPRKGEEREEEKERAGEKDEEVGSDA